MSVGIILPVSVGGTASGWVVTDYRTVERSSAPVTTAGGTASIDLNPLDDDTRWVIDHAVISCTSTTATTLRWYADTVAPAQLLDGSATGNFDVADWPRGLQLEPQRALLMRWTGCSAGAIASVNLQATVMKRA